MVRRQTAGDHRRQQRRSTGNRENLMARLDNIAHQFKAGVRDERGTRIADEGDRGTFTQPRKDVTPGRSGVVLMVGGGPARYAVAVQKPPGLAGILAIKRRGAGQDLQRPKGDIVKIADGGRNDVKTGSWRFSRKPLGADCKGP